MELNKYDYNVLEQISESLEAGSQYEASRELKRIVRKIKRIDDNKINLYNLLNRLEQMAEHYDDIKFVEMMVYLTIKDIKRGIK